MTTTDHAWDIADIREILATHSYACLGAGPHVYGNDDDLAHLRGDVVDVQTANAIVTVFDALNEENRAKLQRLPITRAADVAWKLCSRR